MGLRDQLKETSSALIQRTTITLPKTKMVVVVRSATMGESLRIGAVKEEQQAIAVIGLCTEDPAIPNKPLYNYNDLNDRDEIAAWHSQDGAAVVDEWVRLSGAKETDAQLLGKSAGTESSRISSPPAMESPPQS